MAEQQKIVLYDGECGLCNGTVHYIFAHDPDGRFLYCALQSERGQTLLAERGVTDIQMDTFYYIENDQCFSKSDGALRVLAQLDSGWKWLTAFRFLPRGFRDWFYDRVASNRHNISKSITCEMPSPELRERIIG